MVNTMGSGNSIVPIGGAKDVKTDQEMIQLLGVNGETQSLKIRQEQVDKARIAELQEQIANGEGGNLGKIARIGVGMSVTPDSIDQVGPRFEYTKEDAEAYLQELNKKYPIKEVLGEYYDQIMKGEGKNHLFDMSVVGKSEFEAKMTSLIIASVRAGKWVESKFAYGGMSLEELADYANEENGNPFNLIKTYELQGFYADSLKRGFIGWLTKQPINSQMYTFPKEHLIQDLMRRLGTTVGHIPQIEQK